jgi:hypothetical protein
VLPGGIVAGAWVGVVFAIGSTLTEVLLGPGGAGGPAPWGVAIVEATGGALVGAVFGFPAGILAFGVLTITGFAGVPRRAQAASTAAIVAVLAAVALVVAVGPGVQTAVLAGLETVAAVGGVAVLFAIDSSMHRWAGRWRVEHG